VSFHPVCYCFIAADFASASYSSMDSLGGLTKKSQPKSSGQRLPELPTKLGSEVC
jgi:hypothetical protein